MRVRIHHWLFGGFLGITGLLVVLLVALVSNGLRRDLEQTFEEELARELALGAWMLENSETATADAVARRITGAIGYRASVIDTAGVVLGDSYVDPALMGEVENHLLRPEVQEALRGELSFATRTSATVNVPLLYGAVLARFQDRPVILRVAAPLEGVARTVDRVRRTVALTGLAALAAALLVAYWLSILLARPLVALAERAGQLAGGELSTRVPSLRSVAELSELADAFNRLGEELQARLSQLRQERDEMEVLIDTMAEGVIALTGDARVLRANRAARTLLGLPEEIAPFALVGTLVRQTEVRILLEESVASPVQTREVRVGGRVLLAASRRMDRGGAVTTFLDVTETRHLEQVRRDFVANASHELKTPLTSIRGFAETLLEDDPPEDLRKQFLAAIASNAVRLQRLVEDLLDLSRLESGGWSAGHARVGLIAVASEAWEQFRDTAEERGVHFQVAGDVSVLADPRGLVQVFGNLMENSLRHMDRGGHITISTTEPVPGLVEIAFSDDGEGIPQWALPRIFERFYRADSSRAREVGGTGLGLAIVRHLVGAMGGRVWAESVLGRGTTIRFTLVKAIR